MDIDNNEKDTSQNSNRGKFSHVLEIVKAAFPHLDSDTQQSADLILKAGELMETFQNFKQKDTVTTFNIRTQNIDIEALLMSIRNVCYDQERQLVDTFLNLIKAKNLYDTYSAFASVMATQTENTENSKGEPGGGNSSGPDMMEILGALLTPEQKSTFEDINMMFNAMQ